MSKAMQPPTLPGECLVPGGWMTKLPAGGRTPAPLALYPPHCRWRRLALEELDRAGRAWTVVLQSAGTAGILAALDAGLGITIFPEHGLPSTLKPLGQDEALPKLPDFEFVLRRSRNLPPLAEMIVNFFQLSNSLKPGGAIRYQEGSALHSSPVLKA
jgi:DNA-binding transcriptional LysR family regulator